MNPGIFVGVPTYDGKVHWTTMGGLVQVARFCGEKRLSVCVDVIPGDAFIDKARNTIAHRFLRTEFEEVVFIDADVGFDLPAFSALMSLPGDIVMGMYRVKDDQLRFPGLIHEPLTRHPQSRRLIKMQNGPAGFMRVKRKVFEAMRERWPDNWYHAGELGNMHDFFECGREFHHFRGEDIKFCERAQDCGFEVWAVQDIQLDHTGPKTYRANWKLDVLVPVEEKAA